MTVQFQFTGDLERYDFLVMMNTFIAGFALLVAAKFVMILLATRVYKKRHIYKAHITRHTEDMTFYRDKSPEQLKQYVDYAGRINKVGISLPRE